MRSDNSSREATRGSSARNSGTAAAQRAARGSAAENGGGTVAAHPSMLRSWNASAISRAALSNIAGSDWASDPRFATASARRTHLEALDSAIADWTRDQSAESLESALQARGVPAHRVHDSRDAFEDPQLVARDHFVPVEYADLGPMPYEGPRARLSSTPGRLAPCPTPGEHNPFVLRDLLGLDEDEITELVIAGAIE